MPKLLNIEVMGLERCIRYVDFLSLLHALEKEGVMIAPILPFIDMKEVCGCFSIILHYIAWCKSEVARVPIVHLLVCALRVCDAIMAPAMYWGRTWVEALECNFSRLLIIEF